MSTIIERRYHAQPVAVERRWLVRVLRKLSAPVPGHPKSWVQLEAELIAVGEFVPDLIKEYARREQEAGDPLRWRGALND
jgi:hypothetical protein